MAKSGVSLSTITLVCIQPVYYMLVKIIACYRILTNQEMHQEPKKQQLSHNQHKFA